MNLRNYFLGKDMNPVFYDPNIGCLTLFPAIDYHF